MRSDRSKFEVSRERERNGRAKLGLFECIGYGEFFMISVRECNHSTIYLPVITEINSILTIFIFDLVRIAKTEAYE